MHMADALISPAVGGGMWAVSAGVLGLAARKVEREGTGLHVPMMGVLGAFVFAAQMINFSIPMTGSSGHLVGGLLLAILLGPWAAFLTVASVLVIQALFFADGGLLALGCNLFNMGFFPCFVGYPLYRLVAGERPSRGRLMVAAVAGSVVALQLGALSVVLETRLSGISDLPFRTFLLLMLPIHLAIGTVEGVVTAVIVGTVRAAWPETAALATAAEVGGPSRRMLAAFLAAAVLVGGVASWFASTHPDGLEWAIFKTAGTEDVPPPESPLHEKLAAWQDRLALFPDYGFRTGAESQAAEEGATDEGTDAWPVVDAGRSVSGLVGGVLTLLLVAGIGWGLRRARPAEAQPSSAG